MEDNKRMKQDEATKLLNPITEELKVAFKTILEQSYNTNTKGGDYEKKIIDLLLEPYLKNLFIFHQRAKIVDKDMKYLEVIGRQNEFDIVGTFKVATPDIVLGTGPTVLYDATGFIIEVKQDLTTENLEKDLQKLDKIRLLELTKNRFSAFISGEYTVKNTNNEPRPLRLLFYLKAEMKSEEINKVLCDAKYYDSWDAVVLFNEGIVLVNTKNMPISKAAFKNHSDIKPIVSLGKNVAFKVLIIIIASCPIPNSVNLIFPLLQIEHYALGVSE